MELNLFFEAVDSIGGYQSRLLKAIDDEVHFNKCICTVKAVDDLDIYDEDKYVPINYDICERNRYEEFYDMNSLIPLDRDILEKMLPYESTALKMLVRNMERDIYTYDESKRLYLKHLRFWNHIFVTHKINYVVQVCVPHHCHDYIIYALAKIYNCGIMVNVATSIWNHWISTDELSQVNKEILPSYLKYKEDPEVQLSEYVENYYQSLLFENADKNNIVHRGMSRKQHIAFQKNVYEAYFSKAAKWKRYKRCIKLMLVGMLNRDKSQIKKQWENIRRFSGYSKRNRVKKRSMRGIKYYDSLAQLPEYDKKYVIYYLQYQPEATTLPMAGVFAEQELILSMLARVLKKYDVELWVKEHFVQPYRTKDFYDTINSIPNLRLIKSDVASRELIINSVATASCNGTITQESIFNGKATLLFGYSVFEGAPGTYKCNVGDDINEAMDALASEGLINQQEVRAYLKAFDENSIYTNIYISDKSVLCDISEEESLQNMKSAVIKRINKFVG